MIWDISLPTRRREVNIVTEADESNTVAVKACESVEERPFDLATGFCMFERRDMVTGEEAVLNGGEDKRGTCNAHP